MGYLMKANLTLFYSTSVYLNLLVDKDIREIDELTTLYLDQRDFRDKADFKNKIDRFYINYAKYRNSIKNPKDKEGKLCITYYDQNNDFRKLRVLYQEDKVKKEPLRVVNGIVRELKDAKDNQLILELFSEYDFIFGTEYNNHFYKMRQIKRELSYGTTPNQSNIAKYNKLVKIVHDELIKGYDKDTKETTPSSYYHIRLVDEFLEKKMNLKTTKKINIQLIEENLPKINNSILVKETKPKLKKVVEERNLFRTKNFHGMGDLALDLEEDSWRK